MLNTNQLESFEYNIKDTNPPPVSMKNWAVEGFPPYE